jgi:subtilase family serine protease
MESNEDNNICAYEKTITLEGPKKPDLTCKENGTITCDDWDIFIKDAWVQNIGDGPSEATTICVILSPDNDFDDNDNYQVDYIDLGPLGPGESAGITEIIELANFKDLIPFGTYYIALVIDCDDNVMESNEDNNICAYGKTITLETPKKPDLTCKESGTIYCDDWDLTITNAWIQNIGNASSAATTVCIYLSKDNDFTDNDNILVKTVPLEALAPGETAGIDANIELMPLGLDYGTYYVGLVIDCGNKVEESNEDNNICYYNKTIKLERPKKPDLTCKENGILQYDDWDISIRDIWIQNIGEASSTKTTACLYLSKDADFTDDDNILIKTVDLEALAPYATTGLNVSVELMNLGIDIPYGEYFIAIVLDCGNKVEESNEDNNICIYNKKINLGPSVLADLVCRDPGSAYLDSIQINEGMSPAVYQKNALKLTIEGYKVGNIGDLPSTATRVGVYLSLDDQFGDQDDHFVGAIQIPAIDPLFTQNFNASLTINTTDLPAGAYFIGYMIDDEEKVAEWHDDNNQCYPYTKLYHLVEAPLECACAEATVDYMCESFEKYNPESWLGPQTDCWKPYRSYNDQNDTGIDALVRSNIGVDSSKALRIDQEGQSLVLTVPNYQQKIYRTKWMMKIPKDSLGYVSMLKSELELRYESRKGLQFTFGYNTAGKGLIVETGEAFDYPEDKWFEVDVLIDFYTNIIHSIKVDSVKVSGGLYYNGESKFGAMNFAAPDEFHNFVVDNIQIEKLDELPQDDNGTPGGTGGNSGGDWGSWGLNVTTGNPDQTATNTASNLTSNDVSKLPFRNAPTIKQYIIYPNPTSGQFRIDMDLNTTEDVEVIIINSMGQVVRRVRFDQVSGVKESLDLSNEPAGLYLIRTQVGEESFNNRLLLEK